MFSLSLNQLQNDPISFLSSFIDIKIDKIWTCVVAKIISYNAEERTVSVQPLIKEVFVDKENNAELLLLPQLDDVPLVYLYGGNFELTFPIKEDDECLVFFSKQCIDNWWKSGGEQKPFELRQFDIADGFALVGVFSQKIISDKELLPTIDNGICLRQIDDTINLCITEEKLSFSTKNNDKIKSEFILDKEGNNTYNIYKDDNVVNCVAITESDINININNKGTITIKEDEISLDINSQGTLSLKSDTYTLSVGQNKIEIGSSGITLDNGTCKIEITSSGVNINNGALSIMP